MRDLGARVGDVERAIVIAPHPDDESLATGSTLQWLLARGSRVRVLFATDGENNPWAQRATERRVWIRAADRLRWGARRRQEALAALASLGVEPQATRFLGLPDQHVTESLCNPDSLGTRQLAEEFMEWRPTTLFIPALEDRHPDHSAMAVMTRAALAQVASSRTRPNIFEYLVHSPRPSVSTRESCVLVASPFERERKRRAIRCHASQLRLRRRFLLGFADLPEYFDIGGQSVACGSDDHPLRLLRLAPGQWSFAVRQTPHVAIGRADLLLFSMCGAKVAAMRIALPRRATRRHLLSQDGRNVLGELISKWSGDDLHVHVVADGLDVAGPCVAKLDLPWQRSLGFFDAWPWLSFGHARGRHAVPQARPVRLDRSLVPQ